MDTLSKMERVRDGERIGELFKTGAKAVSPTIIARVLPNRLSFSRAAVIAGKASGNAVARNRLRRRLRAAYRRQKQGIPPGWDVALQARPGLLEAKWEDLCRDVTETIVKAVGAATGPRRPRRRP